MRLTVLGGCGGWPAAGQACSGYLVSHDGFRLLIDPGYAVLPRLLQQADAGDVDAVYAPPDALAAVLALDRPGMLDDALTVREFVPGAGFSVGPFRVQSWLLPHWVPNAGFRLEADGECLAYTGDTGPSPYLVSLARDADVFLAEATYPRDMPADSIRYLSSAQQAGQTAARAGAGQLVLTHLWPGSAADDAMEAAAESYDGTILVASPGLVAFTKRHNPGYRPHPEREQTG
jgi:ribonuclease BN (tRNA processing enzyme)